MSSPLHTGRQTPVEATQTCPSPVPRWDRRTEPIVAPEKHSSGEMTRTYTTAGEKHSLGVT